MSLIICPECNNQVSDRAYCCPQCGYPIQDLNNKSPKKKSTSRRKRLPNGFGSITELKGKNLREPFIARKTIGKDTFGRPIQKPLTPKSSFATYNEAYTALALYNDNPYKLEKACTVQELYDKWSVSYFADLNGQSSERTITSAWEYLDPHVKRLAVNLIDITTIKESINSSSRIDDKGKVIPSSDNIKSRLKSTFNLMLDYAVESKIIPINISRQFTLKGIQGKIEKQRKDKNPFSSEDELILWNHIDFGYTKMILINIYSTWRPDELVKIKRCDVNLELKYFVGGEKTDAGTDRLVPIHPKIYDLVKYYYDKSEGKEMLFYDYDKGDSIKLTYDRYRRRFESIMTRHGFTSYSPSCPRHTFATKAKLSHMDDTARKLMMGHVNDDVTDKHYTHMELETWLYEEICKIK